MLTKKARIKTTKADQKLIKKTFATGLLSSIQISYFKDIINSPLPTHGIKCTSQQIECPKMDLLGALLRQKRKIHIEDTFKSCDLCKKNRHTPLHYASSESHGICSLLVEHGTDINAKGSYQDTPLHWAAWQGYKEICALLLENGADMNQKNKVGDTPLHCALQRGHEDTCIFLVKHQANITQENDKGQTALDVAKSDEVKKVILMYEELKVTGYLTRVYDRNNSPDVIISMIVDFSARG